MMLSLMNDQITDRKASVMEILKKSVFSAFLFGLGYKDAAIEALEQVVDNDTARDAVKSLASLSGAVAYLFAQRPNELVSFALQAKNVFVNHDSYVNIAHIEAQDS